MALGREKLGQGNKLAVSGEIDVSKWFPGETAYVRQLSEIEYQRAARRCKSNGEDDSANRAEWVAACLCDGDGVLVFPDGDGGAVIGARDPDFVSALFAPAMDINGMRPPDAASKKNGTPSESTS